MNKVGIEQQALRKGERKRAKLPLYEWLTRESIEELIQDYYFYDGHGQYPRPSGFICTQTYNIIRTSTACMTTYCKKIRSCPQGREACAYSDYVKSATAAALKEPILYFCRGHAYDFVIPLRTREGEVIGIFVDGQVRPRISLVFQVERLAESYNLEGDITEAYKDLPSLDYHRAERISNYLCGKFADKLEIHNHKTSSPDLDIDAFRRDAAYLGNLLKCAALDGLVRTTWQVLDKNTELNDSFCAVPLLSDVDVSGIKGRLFEVGVHHAQQEQFRFSLSTRYSQQKNFLQFVDDSQTPQIFDSTEDRELWEPFNRINFNCYQQRESKYLNYEDFLKNIHWIRVGLQVGTQKGMVSVAGFHKRKLDTLAGTVELVKGNTVAYLKRHYLATLLTRSCGSPEIGGEQENKRSLTFEHAIKEVKLTLDSKKRVFSFEWYGFIENLRSFLLCVGTPRHLKLHDRQIFDDIVIPVLGSVSYPPLAAMRASAWLHGFMERIKPRMPLSQFEPEYPKFEKMIDFNERLRMMEKDLQWTEKHSGIHK